MPATGWLNVDVEAASHGVTPTPGSLPQQVPRETHGISTPGAIVVVQPRAAESASMSIVAVGRLCPADTTFGSSAINTWAITGSKQRMLVCIMVCMIASAGNGV